MLLIQGPHLCYLQEMQKIQWLQLSTRNKPQSASSVRRCVHCTWNMHTSHPFFRQHINLTSLSHSISKWQHNLSQLSPESIQKELQTSLLTRKEWQDSHQSSHQSIYRRNIKQHLVVGGRAMGGKENAKEERGIREGRMRKITLHLCMTNDM